MQPSDNQELALARNFVANTGTHLFLTGKAGTGKTTFLKRLKAESPKRMIVLAPTGIAAINAGGMTIHSFFQLPFAPFVPESSFVAQGGATQRYRFGKEKKRLIRSMDLLVIDEISMVRADLLDAVDDALRRYRDRSKPFGGVQLLMIGDLQQLAPVVKDDEWNVLKQYYETPYFFSSRALNSTEYCTIELKTVYRQNDTAFLSLLNSIRDNRAGKSEMDALNRRYIPDFKPKPEEGYIRLVTHNVQAQRINDHELEQLPERSFAFRATIEGKFPGYSYPTDPMLELKKGAQVMFVKNDSSGERRFYNGMIGEVQEVSTRGVLVRSKDTGKLIAVDEEVWSNTRYVLDEETKEIREEVEGTFRQYPLKTAWAITIHKSQGLTFERAIVDAAGSFAHGQTYVALSRCRTLEGLVLSTPLSARAIISDATVENFCKSARQSTPDTQRMRSLCQSYFLQLLNDLFDFDEAWWALRRYVRLVDEHLYRLYPNYLTALKEEEERFKQGVMEVSKKFATQYNRLVDATTDYLSDPYLQERVKAAATYFLGQITKTTNAISEIYPATDNKETKKKIKEFRDEIDHLFVVKEELLNFVLKEGFYTSSYLKRKAMLTLGDAEGQEKRQAGKEKKTTGKKNKAADVPADILHPELYNRLILWRNDEAARRHQPVYTVLQQKAIMGITNLLPTDMRMLASIPYLGQKGIEKYGEELIRIVREYKEKG